MKVFDLKLAKGHVDDVNMAATELAASRVCKARRQAVLLS